MIPPVFHGKLFTPWIQFLFLMKRQQAVQNPAPVAFQLPPPVFLLDQSKIQQKAARELAIQLTN